MEGEERASDNDVGQTKEYPGLEVEHCVVFGLSELERT